MIKLKKAIGKKIFSCEKIFFIFILILLLSISGCSGKKDVKKSIEELRTGTQGIALSFLPNNPPATVHADQQKFDVVVEINNRGAYPQPDEPIPVTSLGKAYLSGYDPNILKFDKDFFDLKPIELQGKSLINLNGGSDLAIFKVNSIENLDVEKYEVTLQATACYLYETIASPSVCIDPNPYSTIQEKKVCEVQDLTLSSQGAPIAIANINEEAFALKTQFKIAIKNVGSGDVLKKESLEKCNPHGSQKIERQDIDKVKLEFARVSNVPLKCWPFAPDATNEPVEGTSGLIRLVNGEGTIICELRKEHYEQYDKSNSAFTTPLLIRLSYGYRNTAERMLEIKKEKGQN